MNKRDLASVMELVTKKTRMLREAGQKEYSRDEGNAFANFERVGERCKCSNCGQSIGKEIAAMVFLEKHLDGIHSYLSGHKSQRENVTGRLEDAIVYLNIIWGMVAEEEGWDIDALNTEYDREHVQKREGTDESQTGAKKGSPKVLRTAEELTTSQPEGCTDTRITKVVEGTKPGF